jgi:hypothetical protein
MSSLWIDSLESRMFLSVGLDAEVSDGVDSDVSLVALLTSTTKASSTLKKGWYQGSGTLGDKSGKLCLQVISVSSGKVTGKLTSADWGAFSVSVNGSFSGGIVSLTGKNSETNIKSFKGTLSGNKLSGSANILQMGVTVKGTFAISFTAKTPGLTNVREPTVTGQYKVKSSDGKTLAMSITKQVDGKFWGKIDGHNLTGVIIADGDFGFRVQESDGWSEVWGTRSSKGTMSGDWEWHGNGGDTESGTFTATKN